MAIDGLIYVTGIIKFAYISSCQPMTYLIISYVSKQITFNKYRYNIKYIPF